MSDLQFAVRWGVYALRLNTLAMLDAWKGRLHDSQVNFAGAQMATLVSARCASNAARGMCEGLRS